MAERRDPLEDIERLIERMGRQLDAATRSWDPDAAEWSDEREFAPLDLVEYDDEFVATIDLPGFERDEVDVRVTDHKLQIAADRDTETSEEHDGERVIRRERRRESVRRSVHLPDEVDTDAVTARMNNGVLTVTLPRVEAESSRHVDIE